MTIEEKNHLIAQFMGDYFDSGLEPAYYIRKNQEYEIKYAHFHDSWDWLIPVVQKIYEKKWNEKDFINDYSGHIECIEESLLNLNIEELYDDVVELICLLK